MQYFHSYSYTPRLFFASHLRHAVARLCAHEAHTSAQCASCSSPVTLAARFLARAAELGARAARDDVIRRSAQHEVRARLAHLRAVEQNADEIDLSAGRRRSRCSAAASSCRPRGSSGTPRCTPASSSCVCSSSLAVSMSSRPSLCSPWVLRCRGSVLLTRQNAYRAVPDSSASVTSQTSSAVTKQLRGGTTK